MNKQITWEHDPQLAPPAALLPWVLYEDSLTDKLTALTGEATLLVLNSQWVNAGWWERHVLHQEGLCFQREIMMTSQQQVCWYARTLVAESVFNQHRDFFERLESNSLNILLFREKKAVRDSMICYSVTREHFEFIWVQHALSMLRHEPEFVFPSELQLWGRRSCFLIDGQSPFYLIEFYCPTFLNVMK